MEGPRPLLAEGSGFYKKQAEQAMGVILVASTPPWLLHQILGLGSWPFGIPILATFDDELWYESLSQINCFLPKLLWTWCFIIAIVTQAKVCCHHPVSGIWHCHLTRLRGWKSNPKSSIVLSSNEICFSQFRIVWYTPYISAFQFFSFGMGTSMLYMLQHCIVEVCTVYLFS